VKLFGRWKTEKLSRQHFPMRSQFSVTDVECSRSAALILHASMVSNRGENYIGCIRLHFKPIFPKKFSEAS
jgi:hypothetical protein